MKVITIFCGIFFLGSALCAMENKQNDEKSHEDVVEQRPKRTRGVNTKPSPKASKGAIIADFKQNEGGGLQKSTAEIRKSALCQCQHLRQKLESGG